MKSATVPAALRFLGAAIAFGACGVLSARYCFDNNFVDQPNGGYYLLGLPFALLCTILFMRTQRAAVVLFMSLTWIVATKMVAFSPYPPSGVLIAGLAGGLGVTLSASIGCVRLFSPRYLIAGGVVGFISAWPISIWFGAQDYHLYCAFGIWQAAVGTYLYEVCAKVNEKKPSEGSAIAIS